MKKNKVIIPAYNWGRTRQPTEIVGVSLTKQSEAASCDVNEIVRRYDRTGLITHLQRSEAVFQDVSEIGSYQDAVQAVQAAQDAFSDLPSGLRSRFGNNAAEYLDWATSASDQAKHDLYAELTGQNRVTDAATPPATPPDSPPADQPETG